MLKYIVSSFLLLCSFCTFAQSDILQGPFKVEGNDTVFIQREANVNFPLTLFFKSNNKINKIESYEVDGSVPIVETVFFVTIKEIKNIIVLISWPQKHSLEDISGNFYQVYGYSYSNNNLVINPTIKNDSKLSGMDGEFGGKQLSFKYKDANTIKRYLKKNYK